MFTGVRGVVNDLGLKLGKQKRLCRGRRFSSCARTCVGWIMRYAWGRETNEFHFWKAEGNL